MSNIKGNKFTTQLAGFLLCILLIPTAFAAESLTNIEVTGNTTNGNIIVGSSSANFVNPAEYPSYLSAGGNTQFTVTFTNRGNETITLMPKLVPTSNSPNNIDENWITISPQSATVAPGSVKKFDIEEYVPIDTETGEYKGTIAFTDDLMPDSTSYVYSTMLDILVQAQPKIEFQSSYISDNVEAGKKYEYNIKMKNVAKQDITINPKLKKYYGIGEEFGNDAIKISAPSTIKPGEVANMTISVSVPENATGSYNGYINLNVNGNENDDSSTQISLGFNILQQPTVPFVKTFKTTTETPITIDVSYQYSVDMGLRISPKIEEPSVTLGLKLNSNPVNMTLVKSVENGYSNIGNFYPIWALENGNLYQNYNENRVDTYRVPGAIGDWELNILPKNLNNFGYSVTIGDNNFTK